MIHQTMLSVLTKAKDRYLDGMNKYNYICLYVYEELHCNGYKINDYIPIWLKTVGKHSNGGNPYKGPCWDRHEITKRLNVLDELIAFYQKQYVIKKTNIGLIHYVNNVLAYHDINKEILLSKICNETYKTDISCFSFELALSIEIWTYIQSYINTHVDDKYAKNINELITWLDITIESHKSDNINIENIWFKTVLTDIKNCLLKFK